MTRILSLIIIGIFLTSCSNNNEEVVSNYLREYNNHNYERALSYLDTSYQEFFIDGSIEMADLDQLKNLMEWGEVMESKTTVLSIMALGDTVITKEETSNFIDEAVGRKPRTFKTTYILQENRILKSIIDTVPGFTELSRFNNDKMNEFRKYCEEYGLDYELGFNREGALKFKETLNTFKHRQE